MKALLGIKLGMTSIISDDGSAVGVTIIAAGPAQVTHIKTVEADGYNAVQMGVGLSKRPTKSERGHTKTLKDTPKILKEFRGSAGLSVGDNVDVDIFAIGDKVKVSARSKGKGFAGTIKRHNFARGPKTHGSNNYRKPGSIGSMYPQKVYKGRKMAGRMGGTSATISNSLVAFIDTEQHLIGVVGSVPGPNKGVVSVQGIS